MIRCSNRKFFVPSELKLDLILIVLFATPKFLAFGSGLRLLLPFHKPFPGKLLKVNQPVSLYEKLELKKPSVFVKCLKLS